MAKIIICSQSGRIYLPRWLDRFLRSVSNIHNLKDALIHGPVEVPHDAKVIILLETVRISNITFNADKFVLRYWDCTFAGGNLMPEGYEGT